MKPVFLRSLETILLMANSEVEGAARQLSERLQAESSARSRLDELQQSDDRLTQAYQHAVGSPLALNIAALSLMGRQAKASHVVQHGAKADLQMAEAATSAAKETVSSSQARHQACEKLVQHERQSIRLQKEQQLQAEVEDMHVMRLAYSRRYA